MSQSLPPLPAYFLDGTHLDLESKQVIADTIGTLPDKERLVVSLYYYDDLNMKEIGNILGITESRVCQIHTKAVSRLRSKLLDAIEN